MSLEVDASSSDGSICPAQSWMNADYFLPMADLSAIMEIPQ